MANKAVHKTVKKSKAPPKEVKLKNHVTVFSRTVQKSENWVSEMHKDLKWMDADSVYHLLRAVLQALRDHLNTNEAAQLAAQLPLLLKGTFYECWDPKAEMPKGLSKEEFLDDVREKMGPNGELNFDLEQAVLVALRVMMKHVSPGEMADIIGSLKPSLKSFFEKIDNRTSKDFSLT
jgi:uncharacterized protein (DUF2267 family)